MNATEKLITHFDGESGADIVRLTAEQAAECSHQGDCLPDVEANLDAVEWIADDATLREMLDRMGAWEDLDKADTRTLRTRALWIAACDINENPEDYPT